MALTRRTFLKSVVGSVGGLTLIDGLWFEHELIKEVYHRVAIRGGELLGVRIVQISDIHLRSIEDRHRTIARRINDLKPDVLLITGDLIDDASNTKLGDEFVGLFDPDIPKFAIVGNWEYWGKVNIAELNSLYADHNGTLLINQHQTISIRGKTLAISGVDDLIGGQSDIRKAVHGMEKLDLHVALSHCPAYADSIVSSINPEIMPDLILSGHTHGGQVTLGGYAPILPPGSGIYSAGWYGVGGSKLFVNSGIGTSLVPFRLMARAEYAVFDI